MNELDFVLLFVILLGAFIGWRRGSIRVLISILGIYATVLVAGYAYDPMGWTMADASGLGLTMMHNLSYLIVLVAMTVVVEIVSRVVFEDTRLAAMPKLDKLLGGIIGGLYGALWASLFLVPVQYGIARTGGAWTTAVYGSELVPTLNRIFRSAVLDILRILFINGIPGLYLNRVSLRVSQLFLGPASFRHLFF